MLDKTRKPLFPQLQQENIFFFEKNFGFFIGKCRIVPKNEKGGLGCINIHSVAKYHKTLLRQ